MQSSNKKKREEPLQNENTSDSEIMDTDTKKLLGIFPKEIWSLVMKNVTNPTDYYKICESSSLFSDILYDYRIFALFPSVLQILIEQSKSLEREKHAGAIDDDDDNDDFEKWIDYPDLARFRPVCPSWRKEVDRVFQNMKYHYQFPNEYMSSEGQIFEPIEDQYTNAFEFSSTQDFKRFRSHFDATHLIKRKANPFPTRKTEVTPPRGSDEELDLYYAELLTFLRDYGEHLWYLSIDAKDTVDILGQLRIYNSLRMILEAVPNVKVLWILMQQNVLPQSVENQIVESYKQQTFPSLQNLEFIDQNGIPLSIFMEMTKPNLPKLHQVGMSVISRKDLMTFSQNIQRYPITKLRVDIPFIRVTWESVFDAIKNQYAETLETLYVSLTRQGTFLPTDRISLPNLKMLYLEVDSPVTLDFLLGLSTTLEKLDLRFRQMTKEQLDHVKAEEEEIVIYNHLEQLHKSSIWRKMVKLQSVVVWESFEQERKPSWSGTRQEWQDKRPITKDAQTMTYSE